MSAVRVQVCIQASMCAQRLLQCVYAACTHITPGWLRVFVTGWGWWSDLHFVVMGLNCGFFTGMFFGSNFFSPTVIFSWGKNVGNQRSVSSVWWELDTFLFAVFSYCTYLSSLMCMFCWWIFWLDFLIACAFNKWAGQIGLPFLAASCGVSHVRVLVFPRRRCLLTHVNLDVHPQRYIKA